MNPLGPLTHQHGTVVAAVPNPNAAGDLESLFFNMQHAHGGAVSHNFGMEKKPNLCDKSRGARGKIILI